METCANPSPNREDYFLLEINKHILVNNQLLMHLPI